MVQSQIILNKTTCNIRPFRIYGLCKIHILFIALDLYFSVMSLFLVSKVNIEHDFFLFLVSHFYLS